MLFEMTLRIEGYRKTELSGENQGLKHTPELEFEVDSCKPPQNEKLLLTAENGRKRRSHFSGTSDSLKYVNITAKTLVCLRRFKPPHLT
jgi:hypothetical protein